MEIFNDPFVFLSDGNTPEPGKKKLEYEMAFFESYTALGTAFFHNCSLGKKPSFLTKIICNAQHLLLSVKNADEQVQNVLKVPDSMVMKQYCFECVSLDYPPKDYRIGAAFHF